MTISLQKFILIAVIVLIIRLIYLSKKNIELEKDIEQAKLKLKSASSTMYLVLHHSSDYCRTDSSALVSESYLDARYRMIDKLIENPCLRNEIWLDAIRNKIADGVTDYCDGNYDNGILEDKIEITSEGDGYLELTIYLHNGKRQHKYTIQPMEYDTIYSANLF